MSLGAYYSPVAQAVADNPIRPSWTMQRPGILSLAYGFPDPTSFPYREIGEASQRLMQSQATDALQYGPVAGPEPLREFVAEWLAQTEGITVGADNIIITSGASQGIVLATQLLVPAGGCVIVESPTFIGALWFLRSLGVNVVGVPLDADGIDLEALRTTVVRLRNEGRHVSLVYTMPTVHNPAGLNASSLRRHDLASLANELDLVLLEDDAYGDLIFEGGRPLSLYQAVGSQRVIKLGTFSKLVAGGMRLGWAVAAPDDVGRMSALKADNATSPFAAWVTTEYLQAGGLAERVTMLRHLYRQRRDVMLSELEPLAGIGCTWSRPSGGFFVWLRFPEGVDSEELRLVAEDYGVTYLAGHNCYADGADRRHIRLAYSYLPEGQIAAGVQRLVRAFRSALG